MFSSRSLNSEPGEAENGGVGPSRPPGMIGAVLTMANASLPNEGCSEGGSMIIRSKEQTAE